MERKSDRRKKINWVSKQPFNLLFIDGNHENFDLLNAYPIEDWHDGKVHRIKHNVLHLMRGQVYDILGKKIFTFGGANSVDKEYRTIGSSWWKEEMPSQSEYLEGLHNLNANNYCVDYIITHTCSNTILSKIPSYRLMAGKVQTDRLNDYLEILEEQVTFTHWFFGHFHYSDKIDEKHTVLYKNIKRVYSK